MLGIQHMSGLLSFLSHSSSLPGASTLTCSLLENFRNRFNSIVRATHLFLSHYKRKDYSRQMRSCQQHQGVSSATAWGDGTGGGAGWVMNLLQAKVSRKSTGPRQRGKQQSED